MLDAQDRSPEAEAYYRHTRREIQPLLPSKARRILEVGSGGGYTLRWLKSVYDGDVTTVGIEINSDVEDELARNADVAIIGNIDEGVAELGSFDLILFLDVLEHLPELKIVVVEGGFAWAAPLGWRMDGLFDRFRSEVPYLKRKPSEYLRQHFWWTTQPMEEPEKPWHLRQMLDWMGWDRIVFASDYPHWDSDDPRHVFKLRMSEAERHGVFAGNAQAIYGDLIA